MAEPLGRSLAVRKLAEQSGCSIPASSSFSCPQVMRLLDPGRYPYRCNRSISRRLTTETDVFIAGGGPAGLACAIAASLRGLTVQVVDGLKPPIDKACGEGLMPDTLAALPTSASMSPARAQRIPSRHPLPRHRP